MPIFQNADTRPQDASASTSDQTEYWQTVAVTTIRRFRKRCQRHLAS